MKSLQIFKVIVLSVIFNPFLFAETEKDLTKVMKEMTLTYSQVEYMKTPFTKIQKSLILDTSDKVKGKLHYSKSKARLEFDTKPKTLLVVGETDFWQVSGDEVVTGKIKQQNFPNIFIDIFSKPEVWDDIKLELVSEKKDRMTITVDTKKKFSWLTELIITINTEKNTIVNLKYVDDVQNSVEFKFTRPYFSSRFSKRLFTYTPKKGDSVSRL